MQIVVQAHKVELDVANMWQLFDWVHSTPRAGIHIVASPTHLTRSRQPQHPDGGHTTEMVEPPTYYSQISYTSSWYLRGRKIFGVQGYCWWIGTHPQGSWWPLAWHWGHPNCCPSSGICYGCFLLCEPASQTLCFFSYFETCIYLFVCPSDDFQLVGNFVSGPYPVLI